MYNRMRSAAYGEGYRYFRWWLLKTGRMNAN